MIGIPIYDDPAVYAEYIKNGGDPHVAWSAGPTHQRSLWEKARLPLVFVVSIAAVLIIRKALK